MEVMNIEWTGIEPRSISGYVHASLNGDDENKFSGTIIV
jgi:hypothetical protein